MIQKILVPLDGSRLAEQVLPHVKVCALGFQAVIQLFKINDPEAMTPFSPPMQGKDYLERVRAERLPMSLPVHCLVEVGKPAVMIADWNKHDPTRLIAMATHGVAGARRWLLGSVASKVLQTATNPVLLVRPIDGDREPAAPALKTIIVGLDGSELAEKVLPYASAFARKLNLGVVLLQAYDMPIDALLIRGADFPRQFSQRKAQVEKEAEKYLAAKAAMLRDSGIEQVTIAALEEEPANALMDRAAKKGGALIAMTTRGRAGLNRWYMGSVAERVVQHSGAPVLLVRAD